jgi:hypothetical protein
MSRAATASRWIADHVMPFVDGYLTGDDGGASAVTLFEDLLSDT